MGHSLKKTSFDIKTSFSLKDGNEAQGYVLMSDEFGNATWKDPSKYITAKTSSHYIGEMFGGGVVVSVWNESGIDRCLVASPECISTLNTFSGTWGPYNTGWSYGFSFSAVTATFAATSSSFGYANTAKIAAQVSESAAARCMDYVNPDTGSGIWDDWFLPSIMELKQLGKSSAIFNKVLQAYAFDSDKPTMDELYNAQLSASTIKTVSTDINLFSLSPVRYKYSEFDGRSYDTTYPNSNDQTFYWSSTENSEGGYAWALVAGASTYSTFLNESGQYAPFNFNAFSSIMVPKDTPAKIRPFRLADDTQKQFYFDADYIVITYRFSGERDLDTRTTMVSPSAPGSESGYGTPNVGVGWTPDAPAHPASSTYSVLWHAGDNTGFGYESVMVNLNAFRYYYPGQSEIVIDARAHWYIQSWVPTTIGLTTRQIQDRLDATDTVTLEVRLYKGGAMEKVGYGWANAGYSSEMVLDSYSTRVNVKSTSGAGKGMRVSKIKYNLVGKFGYLQLFD